MYTAGVAVQGYITGYAAAPGECEGAAGGGPNVAGTNRSQISTLQVSAKSV